MEKLKSMTVLCDNCVNAEYAKDGWYSEQLGEKIIVQGDKELDIYEIPFLIIDNIVVLKVEQSTTPKDLLKILKDREIDAIVLENSVSLLDDDIYCFDNEDDVVDYVIEQNKPFTFIDITASYLQDSMKESEEKKSKIMQLCKVSGDNKILTIDF